MDKIVDMLSEDHKRILRVIGGGRVNFEEIVARTGFCKAKTDGLIDELVALGLVGEVASLG